MKLTINSAMFILTLAMLGLINSSMAQPNFSTETGAKDGRHETYYDPFNPAMTHFYMGGAEGFTKRCRLCRCLRVGGDLVRDRCARPGFPRRDCPEDKPEGTCPCSFDDEATLSSRFDSIFSDIWGWAKGFVPNFE